MTKSEIRNSVLQIRSDLSPKDKMEADDLLFHRLIQQQAYIQCQAILLYHSFQSEIDTVRMIAQAWKDKKKVYLPRVEGKSIEFYLVEPTTKLQASNYGILEPTVEDPFPTNTQEHVLMVIPGVAFDRCGNRIGYGAGYYDRYLSSHSISNLTKIALAYEFQVFDRLGVEEDHDEKVPMIITPFHTIIT